MSELHKDNLCQWLLLGGKQLGANACWRSFSDGFTSLLTYKYWYSTVVDGVVLGKESLASEDGFALLTYNYHFTAQEMSGWQSGLSAGAHREDDSSFFGDTGKSSTKAAFSIDLSYKF
jgi:hypothetical protein